MSSSRSCDFIDDVPLEVNSKFFPLPTVIMPDVDIPKPGKKFSYDFASERRALCDYEMYRRAESPKTYCHDLVYHDRDIDIDENSRKIVVKKSEGNEILKPISAKDSAMEQKMRIKDAGQFKNGLSEVQLRNCGSCNSPDLFEDFFSEPNPFDIVEMSTIDDKVALAQVLLNNSIDLEFSTERSQS